MLLQWVNFVLMIFGINFRREQAPEDAILRQIEKCADAVNTNVIEHTAYIQASAEKNNIDLEKYKEKVCKDMQSQKSDDKEISGKTVMSFPNALV